jgi:hypothetical protein
LGRKNDIRFAGDWLVTPRNIVLFIIKYINPYHGVYFHRGAITEGPAVVPVIYRNVYLERNATRSLITRSQFGVVLDGIANNKAGAYKMNLDFSGENITITPATGATYAVNGTGKFMDENHPNAESIAGLKYPTIYLDYSYLVGAVTYKAKDTLVMRERGIKFEFIDASAIKPFTKYPVE